jgi:long-chain acyl-CoA synthetase
MLRIEKIYQAPPDTGELTLGRTIPSLLDEACDRTPNACAFNQWSEAGWQPVSNQEFRNQAEAFAIGLLKLGLRKGDRVAFLMHSDLNFCVSDMACLLAGLVDVPIDLTQTLEHIIFVLRHSEAKALVIANLDLLTQISPYLWEVPSLQDIFVAEVPADWRQVRSQWVGIRDQGSGIRDQELGIGGREEQIQNPKSKIQNPESPSGVHEEAPETACLLLPMSLHPAPSEHLRSPIPQCIQLLSIEEVQQTATEAILQSPHPDPSTPLPLHPSSLQTNLNPQDLATIVYIPDEAGQMEGVMLTHENLSANALASFSGIPRLQKGDREIVLSFLPLNHVLARVMVYGHINYGHTIYFSNANRVVKHFKEIRPTILTTVPLLLEKIYSKILEKGLRQPKWIKLQDYRQDKKLAAIPEVEIFKRTSTFPLFSFLQTVKVYLQFLIALWQSLQTAFAQFLFQWALNLVQHYELGVQPRGIYAGLLMLADWFVLRHWREVFGGRIKYLICGGAALKAELANAFAAAGIRILHGYGLTQASAVVCCNRGKLNRAGTVGVPIPGMEVAIAEDNEILIRGPCVTPGYYKNPAATQNLLEAGWLHTGDLGTFTEAGFLKITGLKKALFKLSTGKYIAPQPIENRVKQSPFVAQAVVVGAEQKLCALLIVPNLEALHRYALDVGLDLPLENLLHHPSILALYQSIVTAANCHLPYWAIAKHFHLITTPLTVENGLLTDSGQINRAKVAEVFAAEIAALYREDGSRKRDGEMRGTPLPSGLPGFDATCPTIAQSLNPRLTT